MLKIAFCDDDLSVLGEINKLIEKYSIVHNQKMESKDFWVPKEGQD